jgi:beta-lactamase regulating signal transducer with metallopeptidase domain
MRPDRATRDFLTLVAVAVLVGAIVFCGASGGVLVPLLLSRVSGGRLGVFASTSMLPAFALLSLVVVGVGLGARSLARQLLASRRLARYVSARAVKVPDALQSAAARAGLQGRVMLVDAPESFSFVYGVLTPRVAVSRGLVEAAFAEELSAVIEHERYHVQNLDPLKIVFARSLSAALFFLPVLGALRTRYIAGCELAADRQAITRCGNRSLAGALVKAIRGPSSIELSVAASIGGPDLLDVRVVQLETGVEPRLAAVDHRHVALSILSTALFVAAYLVSTYSLGGPAAIYHTTGNGLASATVLGGLMCAVPFAALGSALYLLIAMRVRRCVS